MPISILKHRKFLHPQDGSKAGGVQAGSYYFISSRKAAADQIMKESSAPQGDVLNMWIVHKLDMSEPAERLQGWWSYLGTDVLC